MPQLPQLFGNETLFGLPVWDWLGASVLACMSFLIMLGALKLAVARLNAKAHSRQARIAQTVAEVLAATNWLLVGLASIMIGSSALSLSGRWTMVVAHLWFIMLALQTGLWAHRMASIWKRDHLLERRGTNLVIATLLTSLMHVGVWAIVLLAVLENAGVNITTLIASLGVGGVAIALALQNILGDLFAAISIAVDKPFEVGDSITAGEISGTVERIGMKSTHIRSISGEQIVCSNMNLLKLTIQNFKRMSQRRIVFRLNLSYQTPMELVEKIPGMVRQIIEKFDKVSFGRAHFVRLGASSLEFEVVYTVLDTDYDLYMNIQQDINLGIMRRLSAAGADIALPDGNRATYSSIALAREQAARNKAPKPISH
ncbi:MAG TPA: mechanosensitive ion channel family protein [Burkholderiaceae bacterium]